MSLHIEKKTYNVRLPPHIIMWIKGTALLRGCNGCKIVEIAVNEYREREEQRATINVQDREGQPQD